MIEFIYFFCIFIFNLGLVSQ
uniref:Uncharacterized protein n=1 Tax=Rhizophora mucronata TaxID=61149 RepID=A0A2P2NA60_RHIMU